jgi:hypothetical protein
MPGRLNALARPSTPIKGTRHTFKLGAHIDDIDHALQPALSTASAQSWRIEAESGRIAGGESVVATGANAAADAAEAVRLRAELATARRVHADLELSSGEAMQALQQRVCIERRQVAYHARSTIPWKNMDSSPLLQRWAYRSRSELTGLPQTSLGLSLQLVLQVEELEQQLDMTFQPVAPVATEESAAAAAHWRAKHVALLARHEQLQHLLSDIREIHGIEMPLLHSDAPALTAYALEESSATEEAVVVTTDYAAMRRDRDAAWAELSKLQERLRDMEERMKEALSQRERNRDNEGIQDGVIEALRRELEEARGNEARAVEEADELRELGGRASVREWQERVRNLEGVLDKVEEDRERLRRRVVEVEARLSIAQHDKESEKEARGRAFEELKASSERVQGLEAQVWHQLGLHTLL